jgi:tetratricopeptide (TPR) repeat protein
MDINRFKILIGLAVILTYTANAQTENTTSKYGKIPEFYFNNEEVKKSVDNIAKLFKDKGAVLYKLRLQPTKTYHQWGSEKNLRVLEDRIEFTKNKEIATIYFKDILNDLKFGTQVGTGKISIFIGDFHIEVKGRKEGGQKLKDELLLLRDKNINLFIEDRKSQLILFEKTAAEYHALKIKPPLSEEQRKYIVQANAFNEKKMYNKAIELYMKAIELDQTAYPTAYSNLALLSAQVKQYNDAIFYMKKYLILEPEGSDARGAQDKIYEWESEIAR